MEVIFEVRDAEEGGYWARALGHAIVTEGETWEDLRSNVLEAISANRADFELIHRYQAFELEIWNAGRME